MTPANPAQDPPSRLDFLNASPAQVARLVQAAGTQVCVFPINGTRRWFMLEHPAEARANFAEAYYRLVGQKYIELYKLIFDHGLTTLLSPAFGPELLNRGSQYYRLIVPDGLLWLARNPDFLQFYDEYQVRVRVYGDVRRYFADTDHAYVLDEFDQLAERTARHERYRLLLGVCANAPAENVAAIGIRHFQAHGRPPTHDEIVTAYYGEYVPPADLFIGFEPPAAYDMPLINLGEEDLYFTVSPSPYLDGPALRAILYDHLYARREQEDYQRYTAADWRSLADFYSRNQRRVLGLGRRHRAGFWYPEPQVELPPGMNDDTM